ncbi:sulfur carrier protein ThiS [Thiomicrorhabdus heinhorstiae]|uniref:Sulfur carrier protein ThiS n=1 Tax=Thiomicrorhabdus heinhorstiae TaxID=2748010 RepID=A0ABS0BSW3_9GAMM|nr:sulfur carrier protein ThiS [Thiomicrorhabdus heinhorstiae]MBF6056938.1 sulfur carrier protein ThiS [Thiomicrorhabdus heinhorstiae]
MNIEINGRVFELTNNADLPTALDAFKAQAPYAVMVNQEFVPQSAHAATQLQEGDKVEVLGAIQGG